VRVLLIGSGGREHALALAIAADPAVSALVCAPGNPGMAAVRLAGSGAPARLHPVDPADGVAVTGLAVDTRADLVVIGPEGPLVAGVADAVQAKGIPVFGPSRAAARLEGSKSFAKDVMRAAGVPTAAARTCTTTAEVDAALAAFGPPHVVKDDGLAAGKGVVVTDDRAAAVAHAAAVLGGGHPVLVEEHLTGPEASLFVICDGADAVPLVPAQDFKRVGDGDAGPNTGGMGAYAPLPWAPPSLVDDVMTRVVRPTLAEMARRGSPFAGLLYVGLALTAAGPRVVEFNCRFGDPETQVVLPLLATPIAGVFAAAAAGRLADLPPLRWHDGYAVTVVVASAGYPAAPRTGGVLAGADRPGIIHAGTRRGQHGTLVAAGGRVVCATATGANLAAARDAAYALVDGVTLEGAHHRTDIAAAAVAGSVVIPR
jgi:phosphoribosylamine--glycine ligase